MKKLNFWPFEECISNKKFWKAFWRKVSVFCVFGIFYVFFRNKTSVFPKNPKFWTSSEHMSNSKFRDALKKLAKLSVSKSFLKFFYKKIQLFARKKSRFRSFWGFSACTNFWYRFRMKLAILFLKLCEDFFLNILSFFSRKKPYSNVLRTFWAILQFEMHSIKKLAKLAFFRNYQAFFQKKNTFFSKKSKFWSFQNS